MFGGSSLDFHQLEKIQNVSLRQRQETSARTVMATASKEGHWILLQISPHFSLHLWCIAGLKSVAFQHNMCLDQTVLNNH